MQDNLLIDTLGAHKDFILRQMANGFPTVLRALCNNGDGLFWAGDTAQTIAMGSSFRFNDLKAFMFRYEVSGQNFH